MFGEKGKWYSSLWENDGKCLILFVNANKDHMKYQKNLHEFSHPSQKQAIGLMLRVKRMSYETISHPSLALPL